MFCGQICQIRNGNQISWITIWPAKSSSSAGRGLDRSAGLRIVHRTNGGVGGWSCGRSGGGQVLSRTSVHRGELSVDLAHLACRDALLRYLDCQVVGGVKEVVAAS